MTTTRDESLCIPPVQIPWDARKIPLKWKDGRVTEMETNTFLNTLLREYQRNDTYLLNLFLDASIRGQQE
jgi:hypothetical protein